MKFKKQYLRSSEVTIGLGDETIAIGNSLLVSVSKLMHSTSILPRKIHVNSRKFGWILYIIRIITTTSYDISSPQNLSILPLIAELKVKVNFNLQLTRHSRQFLSRKQLLYSKVFLNYLQILRFSFQYTIRRDKSICRFDYDN